MSLVDQRGVICPDRPITQQSNTFGFHRWRMEQPEDASYINLVIPPQCHTDFAILENNRDGSRYVWLCYTPTDATITHIEPVVAQLNRDAEPFTSYHVLDDFSKIWDIPFAGKLPTNAIKLNYKPVSEEGVGCDIDGDVDRFGRVVCFVDGEWWGWYPHPNEPFF